MFESLFQRPHALARHRNEPLADERRRYLVHCAESGMKISTLLVMAVYLLAITKYLRLDKRDNKLVSLAEVEAAATRWANRKPRPAKMQEKRNTRRRFIRNAKRWLQFMGRLQLPEAAPHCCTEQVAAFAEFQKERGLSQQTIDSRSRVVQWFLDRLCGDGTSLKDVTPDQVDNAMSENACDGRLKRVSVRAYAACLVAFFKYAESRDWCRIGMASAIMAPRVYAQEAIPAGPSWRDVQRLLDTTKGDRPADIRDRALLMLLIVYGFRSGEVRHLQLDDLDWEREVIRLRRPKQGRTQFFPFSRAVGDAILRYIKEVRPRTLRREVFLALNAPIRPLRGCTLGQMVALRLRTLGLSLAHYGPHVLRHACATHLLAQGHDLNEIGNYLGHVRSESTRIYAKVDLTGLRIVADFDLEGLL